MHAFELASGGARRRTTRVRVGPGVIAMLAEELGDLASGALVVLVTDSTVAPLYGEPFLRRLRDRGLRAELLVFPAGEASKTRDTKALLEDRLLALGAERDTWIVGVGGGVACDLAGFLAATWHRGVPLVLVPTTVLGMVDAALGAKTAVNVEGFKNIVGSFHGPEAVGCDLETLQTLPDAEYRAGFAEIVKAAAVADARLFAWLERNHLGLVRHDGALLEDALARAMAIKARLVARDPRDVGPRVALNFGHTVAHALEAASHQRVSHGPAVGIGLCVEGHLARAATGFPEGHRERLRALVSAFGLPTDLPGSVTPDALLLAMRHDKKARGGGLRFALPARLGRMPTAVTVLVPPESVRGALEAGLPR